MTVNLYKERVNQTMMESEKVHELTKMLEMQEANFLEKLKQTQAKEREVLAMQREIEKAGMKGMPKQ